MTSTDLWIVVDQLTQPTKRDVPRSDRVGLSDEWDHYETETAGNVLRALAHDRSRTVCHVADYRRAVRRLGQQAARHGVIPALWDQAEAAVTGQGDSDGGGAVPKRERSVADLALMETLHDVKVAIGDQLALRRLAPRTRMTDQIRQVASAVVAGADDREIGFWAAKVARWVAAITTQLNAVESGPKPFRLRDTPCPKCGVRQVHVFEQDEWRMVPPIRIDFRDGQVRAATCGGCGYAWFRGDALNELADTLAGVVADGAGVSA